MTYLLSHPQRMDQDANEQNTHVDFNGLLQWQLIQPAI